MQRERDLLEVKVLQRTEQLGASYQAVIRCLTRAADYKDNETGNHIMRIGESAALLARAYGMDLPWVELLRQAAPMHYVGKIGIPDSILSKPGKLTDDERLHHHEKWDGSGYPQGLAGEAIPLSARIVALCDVYDALRSTRPYKPAWSAEKAEALIREQAGQHFDPALVQLMESLFEHIEGVHRRLADEPVSC